MAEISPLRRRMIEDMTVRDLSPAAQQFLSPCSVEVSPSFWSLPGPTGLGGSACLPTSSGCDRSFLAKPEPDRLRAAGSSMV